MSRKVVITVGIVTLLFPLLMSPARSQPGKGGLRGDYFYGTSFGEKVLTRLDPQLDFRWDSRHPPAPGLSSSYVSVRWSGQLYAPDAGLYYFSAQADDGLCLWVGGTKVLEVRQPQAGGTPYGDRQRSGVYLRGKQWYPIQVEYVNSWAESLIQLYWELPFDTYSELGSQGTFRKIIPGRYLSPVTKRVKPAPVKPAAATPSARKRNDRPAPTAIKPRPKNGSEPSVTRLTQAVDPRGSPLTRPFERGKATVLRSVQFAQSRYELVPESYPALDQLVQALQRDSTQRIEISGHTDDVGDAQRNLILSEYRARQVAQYLIKNGIAERRITVNGYGHQRPIADNRSETERIRNRRVEIVIH